MKKKYFPIVFILAMLIALLSACEKGGNGQNSNETAAAPLNFENAAVVPFSGYISAYENEDILIQIPAAYPLNESASLNAAINVTLTGNKGERIPCHSFGFSGETEGENFKTASFHFRASFEKAGDYIINGLEISVSENKGTLLFLDDIVFSIISREENVLECVECVGMQGYLNSPFYITYKNNGTGDVEINNFSYDANMLGEIESIEFYKDMDNNEKNPTGNIIAPGEEATVINEAHSPQQAAGSALHWFAMFALAQTVFKSVYVFPVKVSAFLQAKTRSDEATLRGNVFCEAKSTLPRHWRGTI